MHKQSVKTSNYFAQISGLFILIGLYATSLYSYLLFHSLAEIFSIVIACGIFMVAWNSKEFMDNNYFLFLGIAYLFIGGLDMLHTLTYKGMGVFPEYGAQWPTQLWIASRYMESLSLVIAFFFLNRSMKDSAVVYSYSLVTVALIISIFYWKNFPICFVEGVGLTPFKKISEYIICLILLSSLVLLLKRRSEFDETVFKYLVASVVLTIGAELSFTFYVSVYGLSNLVGHFFKIISFFLIYKALIETGLVRPYNLLFRNLKIKEEALKKYAKTQEVLLQEVNHRVKNNLSAIIGMLYKEQDRAEAGGISDYFGILRELIGRIEGLSTVHSILSQSCWQPLLLSELCEQVITSAMQAAAFDKSISLEIKDSPVKVDSNQAHHLTLVINELTTNTLKHAISKRDSVCIAVDISRDNKYVYLVYRDDGSGYPAEILNGNFNRFSVGFDLIQGIVKKSLRGDVLLENDNGAVTTIMFGSEDVENQKGK